MFQGMRHIFLVLLVGVFSLALGTGCAAQVQQGGTSSEKSGTGPVGKVVVALPPLTTGWIDPQLSSGAADTPYMEALYNSLLELPVDSLDPGPGIASKWTMSPDGMVFTFDIRKDVRFHDGTLLTPEDVVFTVERLLRLGRPDLVAYYVRYLDSAQAQGDSVIFKLKEPEWTFYSRAATKIVSKQYLEKVGDAGFLKAPVGSGPFKYVSWAKQEFLEVEAIDYTHFLRQPGVQRLRFVHVPEETTRLAMVKTGEADLAQISVSSLRSMTEGSGLRVIKAPNQGGLMLYLIGQEDPKNPMSKVEVRQALSLAIDREAIVKGIYQGYARPIGVTMWNPLRAGFPEWGRKAPAYDLEKAKALLAKAGYPEGKGFQKIFLHNYEYGPLPMWTQVAPVLASQWQKLGLQVEMRQWEWGAWAPAARKVPTAFEPVSIGMHNANGSGDIGNLGNFEEYQSASGMSVSPGGAHRETAKMADQFRSELNPATRDRLLQNILAYDRDNVVFVPMFMQDGVWAAGPRLLEYTPRSSISWGNMHTIKVKP